MADVTGLALPENAVLVQHVPHAEILSEVAVTVTHAGHGTVTAALAHGVPLVCLPNQTSDQPGLAAQVAALGAGLVLDGESATAADIAVAVEKILTDGSYTAAARRLAEVIAAAPGAQTAASRLEGLSSDD